MVDVNIRANMKAHHTDQYDVSDLILRRGQQFQLTIRLDQPFDVKKDILQLQFVTGRDVYDTIRVNSNKTRVWFQRRHFRYKVDFYLFFCHFLFLSY